MEEYLGGVDVVKIESNEALTIDEATDFFSAYYFGEHHIPSELKKCGLGWSVSDWRSIASSDYDELTRLVVMAHDKCIRVEIVPKGMNRYLICITKRKREGNIMVAHPTMEDAVDRVRSYMKENKNSGD